MLQASPAVSVPAQGFSGGDLDALRALEAVVPPAEFWSPSVLGQVPLELREEYLIEIGRRSSSYLGRLKEAKSIRHLPAFSRIHLLDDLFRPGKPGSERGMRALAWAAGLPLELRGSVVRYETNSLRPLDHEIRWLPDGLVLNSLRLDLCAYLHELPRGMVLKTLNARDAGLRSLPEDLVVHDPEGLAEVDLTRCAPVDALPAGITDLKNLKLAETSISSVDGVRVRGCLDLSGCSRLHRLPDGLDLEALWCEGTGLRALPQGLKVRDQLGCEGLKDLRELPSGLKVLWLYAGGSGLESLPSDLVVQVKIDLKGTPLGRLSASEIRKMAPGITGEIEVNP